MTVPQLIGDKRPLPSDLELRAKANCDCGRFPKPTERTRTQHLAPTTVRNCLGGTKVAAIRDNDATDFVGSRNDWLRVNIKKFQRFEPQRPSHKMDVVLRELVERNVLQCHGVTRVIGDHHVATDLLRIVQHVRDGLEILAEF